MRLKNLLSARILLTFAASQAIGETPAPPQWAARYTEGLKAWRDIIYYWIDRQNVNGPFGFGWGEDEEMVVGWPGVMMAADDRRIQNALDRMIENVWYNDNIQHGYVWLATDAEHGPVPLWRPRPDIGLDAWDIMISKSKPLIGESITFTIRVHNIGSRPAEKLKVRLLGRGDRGEKVLGEAALDHIGPPQALVPSFADVKLPWTVAEGVREIGARLDPEDTVDELYEGNNEAWAALADLATSQRAKKYVAHEPATRPSLAGVKAMNQSRYDVPFRSGIQLDGVIGEQEWHGVSEFTFIPHADKPLQKRTWMRVAYDGQALYLALRCEEPDMQWLDTDLPRIEDIYYKDGFEIFLDPGAQVWRYWQFCFDTVPHMFQTLSRNQFAKKAAWEVKVHKGEKDWSAEVRFPFSEFDVPPPNTGDRWRMNVMRFTTTFRDPQHPQAKIFERSHFSPKGKLHGHHTAELFGDLYFGAKPE